MRVDEKKSKVAFKVVSSGYSPVKYLNVNANGEYDVGIKKRVTEDIGCLSTSNKTLYSKKIEVQGKFIEVVHEIGHTGYFIRNEQSSSLK